MGRRNQKLQSKISGKYCIFCGGVALADTIEHAPPRALFRNKMRPKGLEFPACSRCNSGSSQLDQVAACLALVSGQIVNDEVDASQIEKLLNGVNNNSPVVLQYFEDTGKAEEIIFDRKGEKELVYRVPVNRRLFRNWLNPWAAKQAAALWFEHSGRIVSFEHRINVQWINTDNILRNGVSEGIIETLPNFEFMKSGKVSFAEQFSYYYNINEKENLAGFFVILHNSVAFLATIFPAHSMITSQIQFEFGSIFRITENGIERCLTAPIADLT